MLFNSFKTVSVVAKGVRNYVKEIDRDLTDLRIPHRISPWIMKLLREHFIILEHSRGYYGFD